MKGLPKMPKSAESGGLACHDPPGVRGLFNLDSLAISAILAISCIRK